MQRVQPLRLSRFGNLARRYASSESAPKTPEQEPKAKQELPPVEIGGMTFSNIETVRQAERYEERRRGGSSSASGARRGGHKGPSLRQDKGKAAAAAGDEAVSSLLNESRPTATTSDEVSFAVPTKRRGPRQPRKAPEQVEGTPAPIKRQGGGPARARRTSLSSPPETRQPFLPDLEPPSTVLGQGRYSRSSSSLIASLRHCAPPLQTIVRSPSAQQIPQDSAQAAVLSQNGALSQLQKTSVLQQLSQLSARA